MAEQLQLSPALVSMLGACGRSWVGGRAAVTPLSQLLQGTWAVRAALAAQLLSLVEDLLVRCSVVCAV